MELMPAFSTNLMYTHTHSCPNSTLLRVWCVSVFTGWETHCSKLSSTKIIFVLTKLMYCWIGFMINRELWILINLVHWHTCTQTNLIFQEALKNSNIKFWIKSEFLAALTQTVGSTNLHVPEILLSLPTLGALHNVILVYRYTAHLHCSCKEARLIAIQ